MKKLFAVLMVIVLPVIGRAQRSVSPENVPTEVSKAFTTKYPGQQVEKWKHEDSIYSAIYNKSGIKYAADFLTSGKWLQTSYRITRKKLPQEVKNAIRQSKYASWRIDRFERLETKDIPILYRIYADNSPIAGGPDGSMPSDYTDYYNVYISADGKIIKAELTHF